MGDAQTIIELEVGWNKEIKVIALDPLENMLDEGFKKATRLFSNQDYVKVYTTCYNMCTQKSPYNWSEQLYQRHGETISNYLKRSVLPALQDRHGEFLLTELVQRGSNHTIMNKWHKKFFMYLDRYHVKYHQLPSLEDAGLRYFKSIVFDAIKAEVTDSILTLINNEREGTMIDKDLIRSCIQIYETMGMGSLEVYTADFEAQFLESTRVFYTNKAQSWMVDDSTPTYLIKVENVLEEEKARVSSYLNPETEAKVLHVIETEMLAKKEMDLLEKEGSGCKVLLLNDMNDDLSRIYRLFSRVPEGLVPVSEIFKSHLIDLGNEKVDQRLARAEKASEEKSGDKTDKSDKSAGPPAAPAGESSDDPQFVRDFLTIHDKYIGVVNAQFASNPLFQKSLKDAFVELTNRDVGKYKTAELISSFCDRLLKTGSGEKLSDTEVEEHLEKTVQLFSYLTEKDMFNDIYRNQLAQRLLKQRSASDDMERMMIGKLKSRCGAQFTSRMEGMMNDLAIGAEHSANFDRFCKENTEKTGLGKMEFSVQTLTGGHWPSYRILDVNLPVAMQRAVTVFKEYYELKTNKHRLSWAFSLGNVTIKGVFNKKSYDLQVTTVQAIAMLAFNLDSGISSSANGALSFAALMEALGFSDDVLKRVMHSLSCGKYKIIKRIAGEGEKDTKDKGIKNSDSFAFNDAFTCPMRKIRIPMASLEDPHNSKRVDEDRSVTMEAAIVRIMKARKTLSHQQLVAEVLNQLAFFKPDPKTIKRRIEALIDREYLERDADNQNTYKYLA